MFGWGVVLPVPLFLVRGLGQDRARGWEPEGDLRAVARALGGAPGRGQAWVPEEVRREPARERWPPGVGEQTAVVALEGAGPS